MPWNQIKRKQTKTRIGGVITHLRIFTPSLKGDFLEFVAAKLKQNLTFVQLFIRIVST